MLYTPHRPHQVLITSRGTWPAQSQRPEHTYLYPPSQRRAYAVGHVTQQPQPPPLCLLALAHWQGNLVGAPRPADASALAALLTGAQPHLCLPHHPCFEESAKTATHAGKRNIVCMRTQGRLVKLLKGALSDLHTFPPSLLPMVCRYSNQQLSGGQLRSAQRESVGGCLARQVVNSSRARQGGMGVQSLKLSAHDSPLPPCSPS